MVRNIQAFSRWMTGMPVILLACLTGVACDLATAQQTSDLRLGSGSYGSLRSTPAANPPATHLPATNSAASSSDLGQLLGQRNALPSPPASQATLRSNGRSEADAIQQRSITKPSYGHDGFGDPNGSTDPNLTSRSYLPQTGSRVDLFRSPQPLPSATPARYSPSPTVPDPETAAAVRTEESETDDLLNQPVTPVNRSQSDRQDPLSSLGTHSGTIINTLLALGLVLMLLVGCFWMFKRTAPRSLQGLPVESVEVLGNAPLTARQHMKLIRLGNRLFLLAVSDTHSQTLAEVSDPDEVQHLLEICQGKRPTSSQNSFRSLLSETERERAAGFLGSQQDQILSSLSSMGNDSRSRHSFEA